MGKHETEEVYDTLMTPLIDELILIAKEHGIPLFVHAGMMMEDGEVGGCITLVPTEAPGLSWRGMNNRHRLSAGVCRGDSRLDRAKSLMITKYHVTCRNEECGHIGGKAGEYCPECGNVLVQCADDPDLMAI